MTSQDIIAQSALMELFLQNFMCLKIMLQILLKSARLGLVYMMRRVDSRFTMSSIKSELRIVGCSLLLDVLKACYESIIGASILKGKPLNSKINFV